MEDIIDILEGMAQDKEFCANQHIGEEDNFYKADFEALQATIEALRATPIGSISGKHMEQLKSIYWDDMEYFKGGGDEIFRDCANAVEKAVTLLGGSIN